MARLLAPRKSRRLLGLQLLVAIAVLAFVAHTLYRQWTEFRGVPFSVDPHWPWVLVSGAIVLFSYTVLIQTWRAMLRAWGPGLGFWAAARIWCISSLGKYVPGKIWQIGVMGRMAQQRRVSPVAATGSAIISTVINIAVGIAVAMVSGWSYLEALSGGHAVAGFALLAIVCGGLVALPVVLPGMVYWAERLLKRRLDVGPFPPRAIGYAVLGNTVAWLLYGAAFQALVRGVIGSAPGTMTGYIAVYASSYVIGYLMILLPGGLGVRDGAMAAALPVLGLATPKQAVLIALASRLWLTVLEIVPGLFFLARRPSRARP